MQRYDTKQHKRSRVFSTPPRLLFRSSSIFSNFNFWFSRPNFSVMPPWPTILSPINNDNPDDVKYKMNAVCPCVAPQTDWLIMLRASELCPSHIRADYPTCVPRRCHHGCVHVRVRLCVYFLFLTTLHESKKSSDIVFGKNRTWSAISPSLPSKFDRGLG